jgi:isoquinoline 1-oxidoreductase beta subunit
MKLSVNGAEVDVDDRHAKTPLLWTLRDVLGLHGTKFGCGAGFCAACTVLIDGHNTKACQTATERAVGKHITTVEGASGAVVNAVRSAWHRGNVVQCGYCQPAQTLAAIALLESNPAPDDEAINAGMSGNLCRCGTYPRIRAAIHDAAATLAAGEDPGPLTAPTTPEVGRLTPEQASDPVHPYIRIGEDGTIVVLCSQIEMGQGAHTGLATLVAEELDADLSSIRVLNASNGTGSWNGDVYGNPAQGGFFQLTGASSSMQGFWIRYRQAAAQARARLTAAAAENWQVPIAEVEIDRGIISHRGGRTATFAELAAQAERMPVPDDVSPKDPADYKLIGRQAVIRLDSAGKILGTTQFTIDVSLPGLLTALVLHPPRFGAKVASVDDRQAVSETGVIAVVPIETGIAVVGETLADAQRGLRALNVEWDDSDAETRSTAELQAEHLRLLETQEGSTISTDEGDVETALAAAESTIDVIYTLPYLAHAPMEPNNAVCRMRDDGTLEVWAGAESPEYTRMSASEAAGIDKGEVEVHITFAGGSFGLHSAASKDPTSEAVQVARALDWKYPIKLQSLREEEFKTGRYRPMAAHRVRAGTDARGELTALHQEIVTEPTSVNLPFVRDIMFKDNVDFFTVTGAADHPYTFPNFRLQSTNFESKISTMVWRSVGNSHTEFARESALDELAIASGRDPVDIRRTLLADSPRTLRALERAAEASGWGSPLPEGKARGMASSGFLGHSAQVTEISLDARQRIHIDRVVVALDCGIAVNPDLIRAQVEGGLLFGLSAAAWGEVVLGEGGEIVTQNFDRYPIMRIRSIPAIELHLIDSIESPSGVGEVSVPLAAPALVNAIAALTGTRIRTLPINNTIKVY